MYHLVEVDDLLVILHQDSRIRSFSGADAFVEDIKKAQDAGMNGHMAKPLDFDTLAREISRYLERREEPHVPPVK